MPVNAKASPELLGEARAFWVASPGRGEIRTQPLPPLRPGEVLVRAVASAISRGTESLVFRGEVPRSEWQRMRCPVQEGAFPAPVKYGYSMVGVVEDGARAQLGRRVFCLHPHQDRFIVPQEAVVAVPDDVPDRRADLRPIWKQRSTGCGTARPVRATGSRSSAPGSSAPCRARWRRGCPAPRSN